LLPCLQSLLLSPHKPSLVLLLLLQAVLLLVLLL
jgi:hypothetical protein